MSATADNLAAAWQSLVKCALLGTARQEPTGSSLDDGIGELLLRLKPASNESALLLRAGILSLCQRAGFKPLVLAKKDSVAPDAESSPMLSRKAGEFLGRMLGGDHREVLEEFLAAVAEAGKLVPDIWLPRLLDAGRAAPDLRPAILAVVGNRGRWLAGKNGEWNYVGGEGHPQEAWDTAARPARLLLLQQLRKTDAAQARQLLSSTWSRESADDRAAFLAALRATACVEDETLLETSLDDRSKEVRRTAASVLPHLPQSAFAVRMGARSTSLLQWSGGKSPRIEVQLPTALDPSLLHDGIDSTRRQGVGEKGWWLYQIVSATPVTHFSKTWNARPEQIIAAAGDEEWRDLLLEAWTVSAARERNGAWAEALWSQDIRAGIVLSAWDAYAMLAPALPEARRESRIAERVAGDPNLGSDVSDVPLMLKSYDRPWGKVLTRAVMKLLRRLASDPKSQGRYRLRAAVPDFARRVPVSMLAEMNAAWPTEGAGWDYWKQPIEQFLATVQFRRDMLEAIEPIGNL